MALSRSHLAGRVAAALRRLTKLPGLVPVLGIVATAALCVPVAYFAMFSSFAPYDDEGYVLILLHQYAQGGVLYDQLFGQYGPAYFQLLSALFAALGITFTHTAGRSVTLALWVSASALCGGTTYRLTKNLPVALCTQLLVFMGLQLRNEPLHPGGPLCLILSMMIFVGSFLRPTRNTLAAMLIGALLAVSTLIKVNVGVFALVSAVFVLLTGARVGRGATVVRLTAGAAMLLIPLVLTAGHWGEPWVRTYVFVVFVATLSVVLVQLDHPAPYPGALRDLLTLTVSFALTAALSCGWALARGTSLAGLVHGILLDPFAQPEAFSVPLVLHPATPLWAGLSVVLCALFVRGRRGLASQHWVAVAFDGPVRILAGAIIWLVAGKVIALSPFAASLPLLWIALVELADGSASSQRQIGRTFVVAVAVLQALHAYPVAGSQRTWATFLFIPVGAFGIADGWRNTLAAARQSMRLDASYFAALSMLLAAGMLALTARSAVYGQQKVFKAAYDSGVPLNLPGAERVRVPAAQAAILQWLTHDLSHRCKTFITMPGINSLYLFTHTQPPTMLNNSTWMTIYTASQQAEIRDRFSRAPTPHCVIRNRRLVKFWTQGRDVSDSPLAQFINDRFVTVTTQGGYEFMIEADGAEGR